MAFLSARQNTLKKTKNHTWNCGEFLKCHFSRFGEFLIFHFGNKEQRLTLQTSERNSDWRILEQSLIEEPGMVECRKDAQYGKMLVWK